jgi:hypothetical protein
MPRLCFSITDLLSPSDSYAGSQTAQLERELDDEMSFVGSGADRPERGLPDAQSLVARASTSPATDQPSIATP